MITIVFVSVTSGFNRQRMRYGKDAKLTNIGEFLNDHFIPVAKYALFIFISMEMVAILLSTFLYTAIKSIEKFAGGLYYSFGFVFAYRTLFGRFVFAFDTEYDDERFWFVQIARAIRYKFEREKFQTLFRDFVAYGFADVADDFHYHLPV